MPPFSSLLPPTSLPAAWLPEPNVQNLKNSRSALLDLPQEIKDRIFGFLLDTNVVRFWSRSEYVPKSDQQTYALLRAPWALEPVILRLNKQSNSEAAEFFYKSNLFIRVTLYSPVVEFTKILLHEIASNVTIIGAELQKTAACNSHAMDVDLSIHSGTERRSQFIIPHSSLHGLVSLLSTICNGAKSDQVPISDVHIHVRNFYNVSHQAVTRKLLEPWRSIFNIPQVRITWPSGPADYIRSLQADMSRQAFDIEAWIQSLQTLKDNGMRAFENGVLDAAIKFFNNALSQIKKAYEDVPGSHRNEMLTKGEDFSQTINRLRYDCELHISMAWVNLEDHFETARMSAMNSYHISCNTRAPHWGNPQDDPPNDESWFLDSDRAAALFCDASAAMALGKFQDALTQLEEARRLNPYEPGIIRAVAQAERRLNE